MASSETPILKSIIEYLGYLQWPVYRMNVGTWNDARSGAWIVGQKIGTPDICCGYKLQTDELYLLGWIEVKDKAKVSNEQIAFLRRMNKLGCPFLIAHSVEDVMKWTADRNYHGDDDDTKDILDETKKYVPTSMRGRKQKLSMSTFHEYNRFVDKK